MGGRPPAGLAVSSPASTGTGARGGRPPAGLALGGGSKAPRCGGAGSGTALGLRIGTLASRCGGPGSGTALGLRIGTLRPRSRWPWPGASVAFLGGSNAPRLGTAGSWTALGRRTGVTALWAPAARAARGPARCCGTRLGRAPDCPGSGADACCASAPALVLRPADGSKALHDACAGPAAVSSSAGPRAAGPSPSGPAPAPPLPAPPLRVPPLPERPLAEPPVPEPPVPEWLSWGPEWLSSGWPRTGFSLPLRTGGYRASRCSSLILNPHEPSKRTNPARGIQRNTTCLPDSAELGKMFVDLAERAIERRSERASDRGRGQLAGVTIPYSWILR